MKVVKIISGLLCLLLAEGCVNPSYCSESFLWTHLQEHEVLNIPPQDLGFGRCGLSAVKQVVAYYQGVECAEDIVVDGRFYDAVALVNLLRSFSVPASLEVCDLTQVAADISKGHPVILLVSPVSGASGLFFPKAVPRHVWVIRGVSGDNQWWAVNTPEAGLIAVRKTELLERWKLAGNVIIRAGF